MIDTIVDGKSKQTPKDRLKLHCPNQLVATVCKNLINEVQFFLDSSIGKAGMLLSYVISAEVAHNMGEMILYQNQVNESHHPKAN